MMLDCTAMLNSSGEQVATIGLNEAYKLWQIVVLQREEMEFFFPTKEMAFAAWNAEFDCETGFPRSTSAGSPSTGRMHGLKRQRRPTGRSALVRQLYVLCSSRHFGYHRNVGFIRALEVTGNNRFMKLNSVKHFLCLPARTSPFDGPACLCSLAWC